MSKKSQKEEIFDFIKQYLSNKMNAEDFCNRYVEIYNLKLNSSILTALEKEKLSQLNSIASRFSNIAEDLIAYPGAYFNEKQLKAKVIEIANTLKILHK